MMRFTKYFAALQCAALLLLALTVASCGGGNPVAAPPVAVYKTLGSLACTGGGNSLPTMVKQLTDAGVTALASSCGHDGLDRIALCGIPDGRIAIVDVPAEQTGAAQALGFAPLTTLPMAVKTSCI